MSNRDSLASLIANDPLAYAVATEHQMTLIGLDPEYPDYVPFLEALVIAMAKRHSDQMRQEIHKAQATTQPPR